MRHVGIRLQEGDDRMDAPENAGSAGTIVDFDRVLAGLRRQRWVYAAWIGAMIVLALAIAATTPPTWRAAARLMLIGDATPNVEGIGASGQLSTDDVRTAEQILESRALALEVAQRLDLAEREAFTDRPVALSSQVIGSVMGTLRSGVDSVTGLVAPEAEQVLPADAPQTEAERAEAELQEVARRLQGDVGVGRVGQSAAIELSVELHDPVLAAEIANAYADTYATDELESAFERSAETTEWLQQRLAELEADARAAAVAAQEFRIENGLVTVDDRLVSEGNVDQLNVELTEAQAEAARVRARVAAFERALTGDPQDLVADDGLRLSLPGTERLDELRDRLNALESRRDEVVRNFGADHPRAVALDDQISDAAQRLYDEMARQAELARGDLEVAEAQVASLREALDPVVQSNEAASNALVELRLLEQRAEALSRLHETFLVKFQEVEQFASFPVSNVRILTRADVPRNPIAPSNKRAVLLAVLLGLFFGTIHAVWREWRDRSLRTAAQITDALGETFLGYLPVLRRGDRIGIAAAERMRGRRGGPPRTADGQDRSRRPRWTPETAGMPVVDVPLANLADPGSRYAETLRTVRNATSLASAETGGNVIGLTSLDRGEGKTHVATDLADILSLQYGPTLLIDCDPRGLGLSRSLGLPDRADMAAALHGEVPWTDALARIDGTEVDVLTWASGSPIANPSEMLGSGAMHDLVATASRRYAKVVLDLPPLGPVVDVREIMPAIDQIVMLAEWGKTTQLGVQRALSNDRELRARLVGIALNKVDLNALRRYVDVSSGTYLDPYGAR